MAIDGIAIAVNPHLKVPDLSVAQIKDIYTGKIYTLVRFPAAWKKKAGFIRIR
nr:hypothetical protein [Fischerella thermalis]